MAERGIERIDWNAADDTACALAIAHRAESVDGYPPFNDQMIIDMKSGSATIGVLRVDGVPVAVSARCGDTLELVTDPPARRRGMGRQLARASIDQSFADGRARVNAWAHGTSTAASTLAAQLGMSAVREIHRLGISPADARTTPALPAGTILTTFTPGEQGENEWIDLNRAAFVGHPEQSSLTKQDFLDRMQEAWFAADGILISRDAHGESTGYCWTKITPANHGIGSVGEIYALGVRPEQSGRGIGKALLDAGLEYLCAHGVTDIILYVDGTNVRALELYKRRGFTKRSTDTQFIVER